jgi:hypothetical protein
MTNPTQENPNDPSDVGLIVGNKNSRHFRNSYQAALS